MTTMETTTRVGPDGVLTLMLPLGADAAGQDVSVLVSPVKSPITVEEWQAKLKIAIEEWIKNPVGPLPRVNLPDHFGEIEKKAISASSVGGWQGEFERPPQDLPLERGCFDDACP